MLLFLSSPARADRRVVKALALIMDESDDPEYCRRWFPEGVIPSIEARAQGEAEQMQRFRTVGQALGNPSAIYKDLTLAELAVETGQAGALRWLIEKNADLNIHSGGAHPTMFQSALVQFFEHMHSKMWLSAPTLKKPLEIVEILVNSPAYDVGRMGENGSTDLEFFLTNLPLYSANEYAFLSPILLKLIERFPFDRYPIKEEQTAKLLNMALIYGDRAHYQALAARGLPLVPSDSAMHEIFTATDDQVLLARMELRRINEFTDVEHFAAFSLGFYDTFKYLVKTKKLKVNMVLGSKSSLLEIALLRNSDMLAYKALADAGFRLDAIARQVPADFWQLLSYHALEKPELILLFRAWMRAINLSRAPNVWAGVVSAVTYRIDGFVEGTPAEGRALLRDLNQVTDALAESMVPRVKLTRALVKEVSGSPMTTNYTADGAVLVALLNMRDTLLSMKVPEPEIMAAIDPIVKDVKNLRFGG